jgi:hypothetical protein
MKWEASGLGEATLARYTLRKGDFQGEVRTKGELCGWVSGKFASWQISMFQSWPRCQET